MLEVHDLLFKNIKEINFDQYFNDNLDTKLHSLLNVPLLFISHYKARTF